MVLEFMLGSVKLIAIFIALAAFVLSLLFKTMSAGAYYYYIRDMDFLVGTGSLSNSRKIAEKFKPLFTDIKIDSLGMGEELEVSAWFFRYLRFKRYLPDKKFNYEDLI